MKPDIIDMPIIQDGRDFYFAEISTAIAPFTAGYILGELIASFPCSSWQDDQEHAETARAWFLQSVTFCRKSANIRFV